ncbi:MAG TPA: hypothetical protein VE377_17000 [Candidatus Dormibacteraeota bacterium]|nr:hypothetical protein [Candidatus Dormibacteraeota bacterium]
MLGLAPAVLSGSLFAQTVSPSAAEPVADAPVLVASVEMASADAFPLAPEMPTLPVHPIAAMPAAVVIATPVTRLPRVYETHPFWDRENRILFTACGAMATADFFTTRANLASGGRELDPIARVFSGSTPGLAANFALETGGVISISYMFHKTGHHKLERVTSFVNIAGSASAVAYGLAHR